MIKKNQNKTTNSSNIGRKQPTWAGKMATPEAIALLLLEP